MAIEDIWNQALIAAGYQGRPVGDAYEGSRAARLCLEIWAQTRDEILDAGEWPMARRANVPLTLLKGPPPAGGYNPAQPWSAQYPAPGWLYSYAYPDDMLELRALLPMPGMMFDRDPRPQVWRVDNDNSKVDRSGAKTAEMKIILANTKGALAVYMAQVTDPDLWEPGFIATLIEALAKKLSLKLGGNLDLERQKGAEATAVMTHAERGRG